MYIVREKQTKRVLFHNPIQENTELQETEIYPKFNLETMEMGWVDSETIPKYFVIKDKKAIILNLVEAVEQGFLSLQPHQKVENNQIVEKSLLEKHQEGILTLSPAQKIVGNEIVSKTIKEQIQEGLLKIKEPFQYVAEDDSIKKRTVKEALDLGFIKSTTECEKALLIIAKEIERKIAVKYKEGRELKLLKDFTDWLYENRPVDDPRETKYLEMQAYVKGIRAEYQAMDDQIVQIMSSNIEGA